MYAERTPVPDDSDSGFKYLRLCKPGVWVPEAGTSAQSPVIENNGTPVASRPIQNYVSGLGLTNILTDLGTQINIQQGIDTTAVVSQASEQSGQTLMCASASGSGTAYTCNLSPP